VILIDANIPMYLVGSAHPNKERARILLERAAASGERLVTDAEVLQEIVHRYTAIRRKDAIAAAFDAVLSVVDEVLSIERSDVERAHRILLKAREMTARDAIHVAVMLRHDVAQVMSFDRGLDGIPGITRLGD
jgi:predicted nucleic acid-binding protein